MECCVGVSTETVLYNNKNGNDCRKTKEMRLSHSLDTLNPQGINERVEFIKNITQTAVTNIMEQRMLLIFKCISNLTFRMLRHTSSEVTVRLSYNKFKTGCGILVTSK